MTRFAKRQPLTVLLAFCLAPASALAQERAAPPDETAALAAATRNYELDIQTLEARGGAYTAELPETLLELGLALQSQDRHPEAIEHLKRGVHLARVNDGLYSTTQIPLLMAEINSHKAVGDYAAADQRHAYLYRVQLQSGAGNGALADAYLQQADWQYDAYRLGLGGYDFGRLMNMWDLYRLALEERAQAEGDMSLALLPPLQGMLHTLYLISDYEFEQSFQVNNDDMAMRGQLQRFNAYKSQAFDRGTTVITYMRSIQLAHGRDYDAARTQLLLGNWNLLHGKRSAAWEAYTAAEQELTPDLVAKYQTGSPLLEPVALPELPQLRKLPPAVPRDEGDILLEFAVTASGKVVDLERLDDNEALDGTANRLMRQLRRTRFRPKFEAGEPVATQNIVRAFDVQ